MDTAEPQVQRGKAGEPEIYTLGRFVVRCGDSIVSEDVGRSYHMWELFKYLITYRGKSHLPEAIVEKLWPNNNYDNPKRVLRTLVYRLRKLLAKTGFTGNEHQHIVSSQGGYSWNPSLGYRLDAAEFEALCKEAQSVSQIEPMRAIALYLKAGGLYEGDYLPECSCCDWVMPMRNYYRRLYLESVVELINLLKKAGRYAEIVLVCERAFLIEPYEEDLHLQYLDALLHEDKLKQARTHYEYVTSLLYRELGIKPSTAFRALYRRMQADSTAVQLDLAWIQEMLSEKRAAEGAFHCDPEVFRFLYKLERRRSLRSGRTVFLGLLTITAPDYGLPPERVLEAVREQLHEILLAQLRKGDVITNWNEAQFLAIMPDLSLEQGEKVLGRIRDSCAANFETKDAVLRYNLQSILSAETLLPGGAEHRA